MLHDRGLSNIGEKEGKETERQNRRPRSSHALALCVYDQIVVADDGKDVVDDISQKKNCYGCDLIRCVRES